MVIKMKSISDATLLFLNDVRFELIYCPEMDDKIEYSPAICKACGKCYHANR